MIFKINKFFVVIFLLSLAACSSRGHFSSLDSATGANVGHWNSDGSQCYGRPCGRYKVVDGTAVNGNVNWYGSNSGFIVVGPYISYGADLNPGAFGHLHAMVDVLIETTANPTPGVVHQDAWVDVDFTYNTGQNVFQSTTLTANSDAANGAPGQWQSVHLDGEIFQQPDVRNQVEIRVHNVRSEAKILAGSMEVDGNGNAISCPSGDPVAGNVHVAVGAMTILFN